MAKSALITGVTGQDGAYLARLLSNEGYQVWGTTRQKEPSMTNLVKLGIDQNINVIKLDLCDKVSIDETIDRLKPEHVYNLAAPSSVVKSFEKPFDVLQSVVIGTENLLDAVRTISPETRFYQASSSEMFGNSGAIFQNEKTQLCPQSPYAVAKACAHSLIGIYRKQYGIFAVSGILFNHESPLRPATYVSQKITRFLTRHHAGQPGILNLGNLDVSRDFGFSGDYVRAMYSMLTHPVPDDFVVATGKSRTIRNFAEVTMEFLGIRYEWVGTGLKELCLSSDTGRPIIKVDPELYRPLEVIETCGDASKAQEQLGWMPKVSFQELVALMVETERISLSC